MKYIKILSISMMILIILSGCSRANIDSNVIPKKVLEQRTMTKAQSNVKEIIGKNYNYILENMGKPYSITYSVKRDKLSDFQKEIDLGKFEEKDNKNIEGIGLLYPKYTSDNDIDTSALYIIIKNDKVTKVETCDFEDFKVLKNPNNDSNVMISMYTDYKTVNLKDIDTRNMNQCIGKNKDSLNNLVEHDKCAYTVFAKNGDKDYNINLYSLGNEEYIMAVIENDIVKYIEVGKRSNLLTELKNKIQI